jgi:Ca2+-binding RTX toxin-like protein
MIVTGTSGNDTLSGSNEADTISGLAGDDWLAGGQGNDILDGGSHGSGGDYADYSADPAAVQVNLATGLAVDGWGNNDSLTGIENIHGSAFNDLLIGGADTNYFRPGAGDDTVDGGSGFDMLYYTTATSGLTVDLAAGTASGGGIGTDTIANIEGVQGGTFADKLTLSNAAGILYGRSGADTLTGGTGGDNFVGGSGNDIIHGGDGIDQVIYNDDWLIEQGVQVNLMTGTVSDNWGGTDTLTSIEQVIGSPFDDTLLGGNPLSGSGITDGFEGFSGEAGNDLIDGGTGFDRASYINATTAVKATLGGTGTGTAQDGLGGIDTLISIEELRGSSHADTLTGSDSGSFESFEGRGGNDSINGMGGRDRASYQGSPSGASVNLVTGVASDGWGGTDMLANIEVVRGSEFGDTLVGDAADNDFEGRGGDDSISGGEGEDSLRGGAGNDTLDGGGQFNPVNTASDNSDFDIAFYNDATSGVTVTLGATGTAGTATGGGMGTDTLVNIEMVVGSAFADVIRGTNRADREIVRGGAGDDTLYGGDAAGVDLGYNHVDYRFASAAVVVDLDAGFATGGDGNDVLSGFVAVFGSAFDDRLLGTATDNYIEGQGGNDTLDGRGGNDRASYWNATSGVQADLAAGTATGGQGSDTLISIENVRGSDHADTILGDDQNNDLQGRSGNDTILGGAGQDTIFGGLGDDSLDGGANDSLLGSDWLAYSTASGAVNVNLATGSVTGADGNDSVVNFEGVSGSMFADTITGDVNSNTLRGNAGNDTIDGGSGEDWADYGAAVSAVTVSLLTSTASGGDGSDVLTSIERLRGSVHNDLLTGNGGDNILRGQAGDDTLDGGAGNDGADYYQASGAVTVRLGSGTTPGTSSGADGSDTLLNFENVLGSFSHGDDLAGNASANYIDGRGGNDLMAGGDGDDTLEGGAGNDTLDGGAGNDTAVYLHAIDQYTIGVDAANRLLVSGPEGDDLLIAIELLRFADVTFEVEFGTPNADQIQGGAGSEVIQALGGDDVVSAGDGHDAVYGGEGNDQLRGESGDDLLDGGTGVDQLAGGGGNDTYFIDDAGDTVTELESEGATAAVARGNSGEPAEDNIGGGIDRVVASISYTLGQFVENLSMAQGTLALSGTGNASANALTGNAGRNSFTGMGGDDHIDGGEGIDTAVYAGTASQYAVSRGASSTSVNGAATAEGNDTLSNVERLQFSDGGLAIDLAGNAGMVAKILGAVFGQAAVGDRSFAGIGLNIADTSGMSYQQLMQLALDYRLGGGASNEAVVDLLYTNVMGSAPDAGTQAYFVSWITSGSHTQASLGTLAADFMGIPAAAQAGLAFI